MESPIREKPFTGRREDLRLITGSGRFTADWSRMVQLHAAFRRSDRANAGITRIDATAARAARGVVAVFTAADIADLAFRDLPPAAGHMVGKDGMHCHIPQRKILAADRVRFVGEEIALVVAESWLAAQDAAELIEVEYEDLPPIIGYDVALAEGAPLVHDNVPGNVCFEFEYGNEAATRAAIAGAHHVTRVTIDSPRVAPVCMEPRGAFAFYDNELKAYEIRCGNQGGPAMRDGLAFMMGVSPDEVRVGIVDVGGAFGARGAPYPEYPLLLHAARKVGKAIKWVSSRSEDFMTETHGRAIKITAELALDKDGKFLALRTDWLCDSGAYLSQAGVLTNSMNGLSMGAGVYKVGTLYGLHRQVMTNTAPTNAFRGAGRPEAAYIVERLVDQAAAETGVDPLELRRRNLIPAAEMPYKSLTGTTYDSGDFPALLAKAEAAADWPGFAARREESRKRGKLRGIGTAMFLEPSGGGANPKEQAAIFFDKHGRVLLYNAAGASGQGHDTVFSELVADWLGIDQRRIALRAGDPDGPKLIGSPAVGSRSTMTQGSAYRMGCDEVIQKGLLLAADQLEVAAADLEFKDGRYFVKGTDVMVTMEALIDKHVKIDSPHPLDTIGEVVPPRNFPSGAHIAEVEIDADTGAAAVVSYVAVDDVGTIINRTLAIGQLHGGVEMSAGHVFGENCVYDPEGGQLLAGSLMDYPMPRADLVTGFVAVQQVVPSPTNVLGAKGAGEAGTVGALPALANAVLDALRPLGVTEFDLPATPERLWAAINGAKG